MPSLFQSAEWLNPESLQHLWELGRVYMNYFPKVTCTSTNSFFRGKTEKNKLQMFIDFHVLAERENPPWWMSLRSEIEESSKLTAIFELTESRWINPRYPIYLPMSNRMICLLAPWPSENNLHFGFVHLEHTWTCDNMPNLW